MAATQDNLTCAVCTEVYSSPRFLPCHHSFCLGCLEDLSKRHGDIIPCPTCRAPATVPPAGVCDLQVNFYITKEALEQARSEGSHSTCSVHNTEFETFHCIQCNQSVCLSCKLTNHEGHKTEHLSETVARCKKTIKEKLQHLINTIKHVKNKSESCKQNEKRAQEKRTAVMEQIQVRYDVIVAMAGKCRDEALQELQTTSDDLEKDLAADTHRVQHELNSLLQLQSRAQRALSSACDTEVLEVEREMTRGEGSAERLKEREALLPVTSYRPVLHADFINCIVYYMKTFVGSPVKLRNRIMKTVDVVRIGRCGDGGCREVHSLRQQENGSIDVYYGGTGGDYTKEKGVTFNSNGRRGPEKEFGMRISCGTRKNCILRWQNSLCYLGSKNASMYSLKQNFATGECFLSPIMLKSTDGKERCVLGTPLIHPKIHIAHNFDSNKEGSLFAVVEEYEYENSNTVLQRTEKTVFNQNSRVVRLYSNESGDPITTYMFRGFFPTDVCFCGNDLLLIADWMNDCVHVTRVSNLDISFIDYLPGSGDILRPTALNLDLNGQLLIGCGDGWVLRYPGDLCALFRDR